MFSIARVDDEVRFNEKAAQGELMFNYAFQGVYREQGQEIYQLSPNAQKPDQRRPHPGTEGAARLDHVRCGRQDRDAQLVDEARLEGADRRGGASASSSG